MREMLTVTAAIVGAGYDDVALLTDGRFSGPLGADDRPYRS